MPGLAVTSRAEIATADPGLVILLAHDPTAAHRLQHSAQ